MLQTAVTVKLCFLHFPHKDWLQQQVKWLQTREKTQLGSHAFCFLHSFKQV